MSRNFAREITEQMASDLQDTYTDAQRDAQLLDDLRAMTPEARRAWLRTATPAQLRRLAECYAAEAGALSEAERIAQREQELLAKQAELLAEVAGVPATLPPMALMQEIASETAALLNRLVIDALAAGDKAETARFRRERNATNTAAGQLAQRLPLLAPDGSWLVKSKQDNGPTYRVQDGHCSCPAGDNHQACEHAMQIELINAAWDRMAADAEPAADDDDGDPGQRVPAFGFASTLPNPAPAQGLDADACLPLGDTAALGARLARARAAIAA
jgi:hypothetical protein